MNKNILFSLLLLSCMTSVPSLIAMENSEEEISVDPYEAQIQSIEGYYGSLLTEAMERTTPKNELKARLQDMASEFKNICGHLNYPEYSAWRSGFEKKLEKLKKYINTLNK